MATTTLKGVNRTAWASTVPSQAVNYGQQYGAVHFSFDYYTWAADSVLGDIVTLMRLPKNCTIIDCKIGSNDHGSAGQYDIGWLSTNTTDEATDDDAFCNEFNPEGTGGNVFSIFGAGLTAGTGVGAVVNNNASVFKRLAADVDVTITVTEASNVGTGATIYVGILFAQ